MEKCRRMKRLQCMSRNWIYSLQWKFSRIRIAREALRWTRIIIWVDQRSKTTSHFKNRIRIQCNTENFVPIVGPGLSTSSSSSLPSSTSMTPSRQEIDHPTSSSSSSTTNHAWHLQPCQAKVWLDKNGETRTGWITILQLCQVNVWKSKNGETRTLLKLQKRSCWLSQPKNPKPNKNKDHDLERGDLFLSDIPEWLQEFRENLADDKVPEHGDSHASSSHEISLEPTFKRREDLGKHSVCTHFPKDRNCEICKRTKITRAPCRRRTGEAVPRAEKFGD